MAAMATTMRTVRGVGGRSRRMCSAGVIGSAGVICSAGVMSVMQRPALEAR